MKCLREHTIFFLILPVLAGCVKESEWETPGDGEPELVVEAILTNERKQHEVYLNHSVDGLNEEPCPVTGATVIVGNESTDWILEEDTAEAGTYRSDSTFMAVTFSNYNLQVFFGGMLYSARSTMVEGQYFSELKYQRNAEDDLYHIDYVASAFNATSPAMWEVLIDWSGVTGYGDKDPSDCRARLLFYSLPTLDVSEIFAPAVEQVSFPGGSLIVQRRYSLAPAHADYIRSLLLETTWQGSLFPSANANVHSNLSGGAIGFFGICAVTELSLIVD
ncbi:MAG: DUF4249 family protein [Bacteroidales bacterium]